VSNEDIQPDDRKYLQHILLVTTVILLPGVLGALFGWVHGLLPLLIFYYLQRYGNTRGKKYILFGCVLACIGGLAFQIFEQLLFSITLIPVGFALSESAKKGDTIFIAGIKGTITLAGSWMLMSTILTLGMEHHPYTLLIKSLNQGMDEAIVYYKANSSVPPETLYLLEQTFARMKVWTPRIMPGILACITLLITWFTMAVGNRMLYKNTGAGPWPDYKFWKLPEKFVWIFILSAILVVMQMEPGITIGINILMVSTLMYCFQGMAIMLFYFSKWSVPLFLRTLIYVLLFFQTFGVILLGILGVADVWTDIRRLNSSEQETDTK